MKIRLQNWNGKPTTQIVFPRQSEEKQTLIIYILMKNKFSVIIFYINFVWKFFNKLFYSFWCPLGSTQVKLLFLLTLLIHFLKSNFVLELFRVFWSGLSVTFVRWFCWVFSSSFPAFQVTKEYPKFFKNLKNSIPIKLANRIQKARRPPSTKQCQENSLMSN